MKTYNDPAKQLWREKLREFIVRQFPDRLVRKNLRVACFPGAEQEGEEALEVIEVYDQIDIQRKNIVGLEREAEYAQRLRSANLGMEVVDKNANEYFLHENPKPFDIISLDYKGQQTLEECLTLEYIASRQLLSHNGILATNYFGSREGDSMKKLLVSRILALDSPIRALESISIEEQSSEKFMAKRANEVESLAEKVEVERLRDGITTEIINIFSGGTINRPIGKHMFSEDPYKEKILTALRKELDATIEERLPFLHKVNGFSDARNRKYEQDKHPHEQSYFRVRRAEAERALHSLILPESAQALLSILSMKSQKSYIPKTLERYEYTSNTGSSMVSDFFAFQSLPKRLALATEGIISYSSKEREIKLNLSRVPLEIISERILKVTLDFYETVSVRMVPRIKLIPENPRSISIPSRELYEPSPTEKQEIYSFLREGGAADSELCNTYNITSRQLGSYKAWVKMNVKRTISAIGET